MARPRPSHLLIGLLLLAAGLAAAALGWRALADREAGRRAVKVSGTVEATRVEVAAKISGRILAIAVREGEAVVPGQLLVRLDDEELEAAAARLAAALGTARAELRDLEAGARREELEEAQAAVARARARLRDLEAGARPEEIEEATRAVEHARARLEDLEAGARPQEIEQARSALATATATREWAEREWQRMAELFAQGLVAARERDRARREYEVARAEERSAGERLGLVLAGPRPHQVEAVRAELRAAQERLALLKAGPRPHQVEAARAELRAAQERLALLEAGPRPHQVEAARARVTEARAMLAQAQARLKETRIHAPLAGVVLRKNLEAGETATPGVPILTLVDPRDLWLRAYIPEPEIARVKVGQPARIMVDAFPARGFPGRLVEIASEAEFTPKNVQTQKERVNLVFRIKIAVENPEGTLKPGMPADAVILVGPGAE
ncbi:MAG: efflux RND transporter periplasmic adaptor subunit [Candidatus Rokubacteria bacterium]|nr:efflux RND transporter periplasmic adaptor subunit [Candidatus Rokubacteria bacterium]